MDHIHSGYAHETSLNMVDLSHSDSSITNMFHNYNMAIPQYSYYHIATTKIYSYLILACSLRVQAMCLER